VAEHGSDYDTDGSCREDGDISENQYDIDYQRRKPQEPPPYRRIHIESQTGTFQNKDSRTKRVKQKSQSNRIDRTNRIKTSFVT
jgi:hypothetical protein